MIPVLRQNGAIIGTVLAELIGLGIQIAFAWKLLKDTELFSWNTIKYFIAAVIMAFAVYLVRKRITSLAPGIIASLATGAFSYAAVLALLREKTARNVFGRFGNRTP
jgi:hypothetical protein